MSELSGIISNAKNKGWPPEEIFRSLVNSGYNPQEIQSELSSSNTNPNNFYQEKSNQHLQNYQTKNIKEKKNYKWLIILLISAAVIALAATILFLAF